MTEHALTMFGGSYGLGDVAQDLLGDACLNGKMGALEGITVIRNNLEGTIMTSNDVCTYMVTRRTLSSDGV